MTIGKTLRWRALFAIALGALATIASPAVARANDETVQTVWRLLDYVAVDYRGAVAGGRVLSATEYAEMTEFSASIASKIAELPPSAQKPKLAAGAQAVIVAVATKASPDAVARVARTLGTDLLAAYPVPLAPAKLPDLARGAVLYAQNCASCHGLTGDGLGPDAAKLDPRPVAFRDAVRARERSAFALYQVIGQGIDGTGMASFADLPSQDRWALAFHVSRFAFSDVAKGAAIWRSDAKLRTRIPDMESLARLAPESLGRDIGQDRADAVMAYLRANPQAVMTASTGSLKVVREKLAQSVAAYAKGDRAGAKQLALTAYLDGFEPVEPILAARDATLMARIEGSMGELRASIGRGDPVTKVEKQVGTLDALFADAEEAIAPIAASTASTFLGAFTILLREGLEALLIVVAMLAFLRKADRTDMTRHVHGGWIAALAAGALTWAVATYFIGVSGASRELTEGVGSLFAAVVLLSVGIWMHGKSQAGEWQRYIRETLGRALTRKSAWFLFGLAFLVVYREVFETILFYAALTAQGNGSFVLGGAVAAMAMLAGIGGAMLRYSRTLPIAAFFKYSSWLIAILAVVLAGKGVAALQEAGIFDILPVAGVPRIPMLGLFPSVQSLGAQALSLVLVMLGVWYNDRLARVKNAASATTSATVSGGVL